MDLSFLVEPALQILQPTVLIIATYVGLKVGAWFKRKTGLNVDAQIENILDRAIDYAEERARDYLKARAEKLPGDRKLEIALAFATRELQKRGLIKRAGDELKQWVESLLFSRRPLAFDPDGDGKPGLPVARVLTKRIVG